jgi:hypothetical protein
MVGASDDRGTSPLQVIVEGEVIYDRDKPPEEDPSVSMNTLNIFRHYTQAENHLTNALISILRLSRFVRPQFLTSFLHDELGVDPEQEVRSFRVLREIPRTSDRTNTVDAVLSGEDCCIFFETKIERGILDREQICCHLKQLESCREGTRRLVLLTPDDGGSSYIRQFRLLDEDCILHLGWKQVYHFVERSLKVESSDLFSELMRQFNEQINERIIERDIAGIIMRIAFGEVSGVYSKTYLDEMTTGKEIGIRWNTPRRIRDLDGKGRMLMLYDGTRKEITVEVEIQEVKQNLSDQDFPWSNVFVQGTLRVFDPPIPLDHIRMVPKLERFGKGQAPFYKLTYEQYRALKGN